MFYHCAPIAAVNIQVEKWEETRVNLQGDQCNLQNFFLLSLSHKLNQENL